jgi:hypothetical protein
MLYLLEFSWKMHLNFYVCTVYEYKQVSGRLPALPSIYISRKD